MLGFQKWLQVIVIVIRMIDFQSVDPGSEGTALRYSR